MTRNMLRPIALGLLVAGLAAVPILAQDRITTYPGYDRYSKLSREIPGAVCQGTLQVSWKDAKTFEYVWDGKLQRFDVAARAATVVDLFVYDTAAGKSTRLVDAASGKTVAELVKSDTTKWDALGLKHAELDSLYLKLGQTEIDDMAAGVRSLWTRPYFDKDRVGVHGTK